MILEKTRKLIEHRAILALLVLFLATSLVTGCKKSSPKKRSSQEPTATKAEPSKTGPLKLISPEERREIVSEHNNRTMAVPDNLDELLDLLGKQGAAIPVRQVFDSIKGFGSNALPRLFDALSDANHLIRLNAVKVLGEMKEYAKQIIPHLIALFNRETIMQIRSMIIDALARLGHFSGDVQALFVKALEDPGWLVRWEAARGLGSFGEQAKPHLAQLQKALEDTNSWVQLYTCIAILKIIPQSDTVTRKLTDLTLDSDIRFRLNLVAQIEGLPPAQCSHGVPALLKLMADPSERVRRVAGKAFLVCAPETLHTPEIEAVLNRAAEDRDHSIRTYAQQALEKLKRPQ